MERRPLGGMGEGEKFGIDSEDFQDKDQRKLFLNLSSPSSLSMQK